MEIRNELLYVSRTWSEFLAALGRGDFAGALVAGLRLALVALQAVAGGLFLKTGRIVAGSIVLLGGVLLRTAKDAISYLIFNLIPFAVNRSIEIGRAVISGTLAGIFFGLQLLDKGVLAVAAFIERAIERTALFLFNAVNERTILAVKGIGVSLLVLGTAVVLFVTKTNEDIQAVATVSRTVAATTARSAGFAFLPWIAALSGIAFLVWQLQDGFKELTGIIEALNNPAKWLKDSFDGISQAFSAAIDTDGIRFAVEQFVKFIPILLGGLFLAGVAIKKHILGGFMLVWEVVAGIANSAIGAVRAAKAMPSAMLGIGTEGRVLEGIHKGRSALGLYGDPAEKSARDMEFKLAKESALFRERLAERTEAQVKILAREQKADYGHLAKEVSVMRGGFFGIGASKTKEWQLTAAGEEFSKKQMANSLNTKSGIFADDAIRAIAREVSPMRLGMMDADRLRAIGIEGRPDLAALARAMDSINTQNVAQMNVSRLNVADSGVGKTARDIRYDREELENYGVGRLNPGQKEFSAGNLSLQQLTNLAQHAGVEQLHSLEDLASLPATAKETIRDLLSHQIASAMGRIESPLAENKSIAGLSAMRAQLALTDREKTILATGDQLSSADLNQKFDRLFSVPALEGFDFDKHLARAEGATSIAEYERTIAKLKTEMLAHQLSAIQNSTAFLPGAFDSEAVVGGVPADKISSGVKGLIEEAFGAIGQAISQGIKKTPFYAGDFSNKELAELERKLAGLIPLDDRKAQESRTAKLQNLQRFLREHQGDSEKQHQILRQMAAIVEKDVYELAHPTIASGEMQARLRQAKESRRQFFRSASQPQAGGKSAYTKWLESFATQERKSIEQQLARGQFRGGALNITRTDTVKENGIVKQIQKTINREASLAQALGFRNIEELERVFSTEAILEKAREGWKSKFLRFVGASKEAEYYNEQIDELRSQLSQRMARQNEGFQSREAKRQRAIAERETGFLNQLRQSGIAREEFMNRLNAQQQQVFNEFLKTGKFRQEIPEAKLVSMVEQLGFTDVSAFKKFQAELAKPENREVFDYFKEGLKNPNKFKSMRNNLTPGGERMEDALHAIAFDEAGATNTAGSLAFLNDLFERTRRMRRDDGGLHQALQDFVASGQTTIDLTSEEVARIGRQMNLAGSDEEVAAQLRSISNRRRGTAASIGNGIRDFLKSLQEDAKSIEEYADNRLRDLGNLSVLGATPLAGLSDILRYRVFEPISGGIKTLWNWAGKSIEQISSAASESAKKARSSFWSLPGLRVFRAAADRREADKDRSLQSLMSRAGIAPTEFEAMFRQRLAGEGITDSRTQDAALQEILKSRHRGGLGETLSQSRHDKVRGGSDAIARALAATLQVEGSENIAKLLAPGGFTTKALGPLRNYLIGAVFPAIWDAVSLPLQAVVKVLKNPRQAIDKIASKSSQVLDAIADFLVGTYSNIRKTFTMATSKILSVPLFGRIWGAVSGFFGSIANKIKQTFVPSTVRRIGQRLGNLQSERQGSAGTFAAAREGRIPAENLPDLEDIQRLNSRIQSVSQVRARAIANLNPFQKILVQGTYAAKSVAAAWAQTSEEISQRGWRGLVARAKRFGYLIQRNISEGSPGPSYHTRQNWERTQESVSENMSEMAGSARIAGQQIQGEMQRAAGRSAGFLSAAGRAVAGFGKAGTALGGAVTAIGFAAQTASYSLVNMGIINEEAGAKLNKFLEIFTLMGAVGGLLPPIMGAIGASVGAVGTAFALLFNPVTLTMGAIVGGMLLVNRGLKQFFGIDLLGPLATKVQQPLEGTISFVRERVDLFFGWLNDRFGTQLSPILEPVVAAAGTVKTAWQGFVDWFQTIPLVQFAIDIGTGLINALNHNPTVQIPLAWEGAIEQIKNMLFGLPLVGDLVAKLLSESFDPSKILGNLFQGFQSMLATLESSPIAKLGGGKLTAGLRGLFGMFDRKQPAPSLPAAEVPLPGVKLDYNNALESAIAQADFNARSGGAGTLSAATNLHRLLQQTDGQMDASQIASAYQNPGGMLLQNAISKENNRLFRDKGAGFRERQNELQAGLAQLEKKQADLQSAKQKAIEAASSVMSAPQPTNFIERILAGNKEQKLAEIASQAASAEKAIESLGRERSKLQEQIATASTVFDPGTDRMLQSMGIDPAGLKVAVASAKTAIGAGMKEASLAISDRWRYLERTNGGNLGLMVETDLQKASGAFRVLKGDIADFARRAATSLVQLDWQGFQEVAGDFWGNLTFGLGQAASGFAGAGLSAVLFAVHLSPLAFILGGIALAGLAVATNFLGLRNIVSGLWRAFWGLADIAVSSLVAILNTVRGVVRAIGGIPSALRGDFSQMAEGLEIVWEAVRSGARGLMRGLGAIFGGGIEILEGLFRGLGQIIGAILGPTLINSARAAVEAIENLFRSAGETISNALKNRGRS